MELGSVILIAVGLSMDSFAVSVTDGLTIKALDAKRIFAISFSLALFQALMPFLGWIVGSGVEVYVKAIDHWVAFFLLSLLGVKMISDCFCRNEAEIDSEFKFITLMGQGVATSIDAFAVGISFALLNVSIVKPAFVIGLVTFAFSLLGLRLGEYFGKRIGKSVEVLGGMVLFGMGVKILIEHLYFQ